MLLHELLDIAERRCWPGYAQRVVAERARQHLAILEHWRRSPAVLLRGAGMLAKTAEPGDDAGEQAQLAEQLQSAVDQARQAVGALNEPPDPSPVEQSRERVETMLGDHAAAIAQLPDTLREAIDRDLCDAHRRFVVSGRAQAAVWRPASRRGLVTDDHLGEFYDMHEHGLAGLALSGGGVRSASFAIGAMQGLSRPNLLRAFDFISAVSGGSWAAGWLAAWAHRHEKGIVGVEDELSASMRGECAPLSWARRYIAYLAPRPGLWSGDSWALWVAYVCNWLPVLVLASLSLLSLTVMLHLLTAVAQSLQLLRGGWALVWLAALAVPVVALMTVLRRLTLYYREPGARLRESPWLAETVVGLTLAGGMALTAALPLLDDWLTGPPPESTAGWHFSVVAFLDRMLPVLLACLALNLVSAALAVVLARPGGQRAIETWHRIWRRPTIASGTLRRHECPPWLEVAALGLSALLAALMLLLLRSLITLDEDRPGLRLAYGPFVAFVLFGTADLFGGLVTRRRNVHHAWIARLGGWMMGTVVAWAALCTLALGATTLLRDPAVQRVATLLVGALPLLALGVLWPGLRYRRMLRGALGMIAALLLLLTLLPLTAAYLTRKDDGHLLPLTTLWWHWAGVTALLGVVALSNANRFSLHTVYKQGLVRTFLGSSRLRQRNESVAQPPPGAPLDEVRQFEPRQQDSATNIDEHDNPALATLVSRIGAEQPVLLINAAVNGVSLTDREGRVPRQWPFTFSQRFSGSPVSGIGYARTSEFYADDPSEPGLSLGGAMAVSGAAVSPTAGQMTQRWRAFLLGLLNARLGIWIGNPSHPEAVRRGSPKLAGFTVLREMLGVRAKFNEWIHLSDGGHFENLGIYELVRRGCVRIVAIDASHDPKRDFHDLAHAIRRVRVDLGIRISANGDWSIGHPVRDAGLLGSEPRSWMWFDIDYGFGQPRGRLLYIKPSVYDNRRFSAEGLNYWREFADFPHESTIDQWFSERRMEVYRSLGEEIVVEAMGSVMRSKTDITTPLPSGAAAKPNPDHDPMLEILVERATRGPATTDGG